MKLHLAEDAELSLSTSRKHEPSTGSSHSKIFGMRSEAYMFFVQAQIDLAMGRSVHSDLLSFSKTLREYEKLELEYLQV